ncbi:MAG: pyridoxal phosphate-dependent aminotransferase [Wujia sp.]
MNYTHGGDIYRNTIQYDFSVNVNPLGMPASAVRVAQEAVTNSDRYPDYSGDELRSKIAREKSLSSENVLLGNGAAELIYMLCAYLSVQEDRKIRAYTMAPTFTEYEAAVKAYRGNMEYHYLRERNSFDVKEDFVDGITDEHDIVFVCNPNNPTGRLIDKTMLRKIAEQCRCCNALLVVDESFMPFVSEKNAFTMLHELDNYGNLIVIRAFTKIYAMAGLRLGYMACRDSGLLDKMKSMTQPWNTSVPAQMAGCRVLEEREYLTATRELINRERRFLTAEMQKGLAENIVEGCANYILFKANAGLYDQMLKRGILIRKCDDFKGIEENYYRIAIRSHEENLELIRRWRS